MDEKILETTVQSEGNNFHEEVKKESDLQLSDNEKALIEAQRQELAKLEAFKEGYKQLVQQTGFAWAVDLQSPVGGPKLGITRVGQ
jgi:hypothetical protein